MSKFQDTLIVDFTMEDFRQAFQQYFAELDVHVKDWDGLFNEMNTDGRGNQAFVRMDEGKTVGFIQFCPLEMKSWFFAQKLGFIREFWIAPAYRGQGHGSQLLALAEEAFRKLGVSEVILTTNTAPAFYEKAGYRHHPGIQANNADPVCMKELRDG